MRGVKGGSKVIGGFRIGESGVLDVEMEMEMDK